MKTSIVNTVKVMMGLGIVLISAAMQAQPGSGYHHGSDVGSGYSRNTGAIPNLTEEQEQKITAMHTSHQKEVLNLRLDLDIKAAELQKLKSAENPDITLINKTIDEMGKMRTEIEKKKVALGLAIRKVLTDEQRAAWDMNIENRGIGRNRMPHHGGGDSGPDCEPRGNGKGNSML